MVHTDPPKQQISFMTSYWKSAAGKPAQRSWVPLFCQRIFRRTPSYKIQPVKQTNKHFSIQGSANLSKTRARWPLSRAQGIPLHTNNSCKIPQRTATFWRMRKKQERTEDETMEFPKQTLEKSILVTAGLNARFKCNAFLMCIVHFYLCLCPGPLKICAYNPIKIILNSSIKNVSVGNKKMLYWTLAKFSTGAKQQADGGLWWGAFCGFWGERMRTQMSGNLFLTTDVCNWSPTADDTSSRRTWTDHKILLQNKTSLKPTANLHAWFRNTFNKRTTVGLNGEPAYPHQKKSFYHLHGLVIKLVMTNLTL